MKLVNHPSAKPTRKVTAATLGGLVGPIIAYVLYDQFGISVAATDAGILIQYGQEVSIAIGGALGALIGGYFKRDAVQNGDEDRKQSEFDLDGRGFGDK